MERIQLGGTDITVTPICVGCWSMGGEWVGVTDEDSIATVGKALDAGVSFLDTAPGYGRGHSEEIVGRAIEGVRDEVVVATKLSPGDCEPTRVEPALDDSLRRLRVDYIDLYQIHWPNPEFEIEFTMEELAKAHEKGKIRAIGVSNFDVAQMKRALSVARIESLQPPFSILWREIDEEILPFCKENDISVLAYSPLVQGLLTGKYRSIEENPGDVRERNVFFAEEELFQAAMRVVDLLSEVAEGYGLTPAQAAVAWVLQTPGLTSAIVGARKPEHITGIIPATEVILSEEDYDTLSTAGRDAFDRVDAVSLWNWRPGM